MPTPSAPPPLRASTPLHWRIGVELDATFAALPGPSLGPGLFAGLRRGRFAAYLTARYDLAAEQPLQGGGALQSSLFAASAQACVAQPFGARIDLDVCAVAAVGALSANASSLDRSTPATTLFVGAGASVALSLRLGANLGLRLHLDVLAPITRARSTVREGGVEREVWLAPPASGAVGIGPFLHFD